MSKVVKGVGRAIGNVVKGVANVVKKVASSKFGKILVGAALVYFGGAALMGGFSGAAAGGGLSGALSGAAQGVANAWTSLTGAASSALGGKFAQAGSQLSAGIQGTTTALQGQTAASALNPVVNEALAARTPGAYAQALGPGASAAPGSQAAMLADQTSVFGRMGLSGTADAAAGAGASGGGSGIISRAASAFGKLSPQAQAAAITGGTQLAGGLIQGYGMQRAQDEQQRLSEEQKATYNRNISGFKY